jgi:hypothetical protein
MMEGFHQWELRRGTRKIIEKYRKNGAKIREKVGKNPGDFTRWTGYLA